MNLMLYFLRHGQTAYSRTGGFCGTPESDPGLTADGICMAEAFAQAYRSIPWKAIFSSPLCRALQTAEPLSQATGLNVQTREGLAEVSYGGWEGRHPSVINREFHDDYVRWLTDPAWNSPTDGERAIDIARRSSLVLEEIEQTYSDGCVLVVSHKATIRIMLCALAGIDVGRYRDRMDMPTAALSVVELANRGPLFHSIADRSHLNSRLQALPFT
ncbi:MAG: histidine phosphatase family protein [Synechococcus sp.]